MARNLERDEREMELRRNKILEAGLELFSTKGIEAVSLQAVADKADVGVATLYNYYENKVKLCVAISSWMWGQVWEETVRINGADAFEVKTAIEIIELYIDDILRVYRDRPDILRFSSEYKTFVCRDNKNMNEVKEHLEILVPVDKLFHDAYEKAKTDRTIRTDIPEHELFTTVALTVLGMAERYAQGIVWAMTEEKNYTNELLHLKDMVLLWLKDGIK